MTVPLGLGALRRQATDRYDAYFCPDAILALIARVEAAEASVKALEAVIAGVKFGGYPAHGSGLVTIVTDGVEALQAVQDVLKTAQGGEDG